MGILRNTIILGAAVLAMPSPPAQVQPDGVVPPTASSFAYITAATETFADVRAFCQRRPAVCDTAGVIAVNVEAKAKYSARLIYEWANEAGAEQPRSSALTQDLATADPIATGTADAKAGVAVSQSTLTLADLIPEWKVPQKPKKG